LEPLSGNSITLRILQNAAAFLGGEFFYRFINFLSCILIARSLGGEGYGQFSFIYVYLSFFEIFVQFGLNAVLTRELSQEKNEAPRILGNALILRTALIILTLPLAFWLTRLIGYPLTVQQGVLLASFQLFLTLRPVFETIFRVGLLMIVPAIWNAGRALLNLLFVGLVTWAHPSLIFFIAAYLASGVVGLIGLSVASARRMPFDFRLDKNLILHLLKQSLPLMFSGYLTILYYRIDVMMLSVLKTFREVGYYSVATRLSESLNMISGALLISFFPLCSQAFKASRMDFESLFTKIFKWMMLAGLPIALGGMWVANDLIILFFGPEYSPSGATLSILLWYTFFSFIGSLLANVLIASGKQTVDMWISLALVFLNVTLNWFLIPRYSFNGAAVSTVLTEIVGVVIYFSYAILNSEIRLFIPRRELANVLKINAIFLILILLIRWRVKLPAMAFIGVGFLGYLGLLFIFRAVSWKELVSYVTHKTTKPLA